MSESLGQSEQIGVLVRKRRKSLGMTQGELADLAGVSQRFIYDLERGKASVALDRVLAVLATLGLRINLELAN
jgi:y4mF family transcriptional regulator